MKANNPSHACALTLVDEFARAGVVHACLAPGSRSAALAMALARDDRIRVHVCIDERSAAFMALGVARATRVPAIVLSTSGTATASFHPAVIEADASRVPMLVVTADRPPELRSTGANQTIDQLKLYGDSVRWFCELGVPEERPDAPVYWRSAAARSVSEALGGPAGPAHMNVAMREPLVPEGDGYPYEIGGRADGSSWTTVTSSPRPPDPTDLQRLSELIASSERPMLVAGEGAFDARAVVEFSVRAGIPLLAEPLSNGRWGPNAISTYDPLLRVGFGHGTHPDLAIRIGRIATSRALARYLSHDVNQVMIDPDRWWLDPGRTSSWLIAADVGATLNALVPDESPEASSWLARWLDAEGVARAALDRVLDESDELSEPRTARDLAALMPSSTNLVVASSMPVRDLDSFMDARGDLRIFGNRGASGIDGFVSTALGVALGSRKQTFALAGDLSLLHDQNGLIGARDLPADVTFVVLNNDGGGIFSFLPQAKFERDFELLFGTPHGIDFGSLAATYGLEYTRIERASELEGALRGAGVRIVEVRTDRAENVEIHRRAWRAVEEALDL
jgi:2-succinyl-5-enolpyruvyl-6-hydroxy-3-cyclohexene-1-carboxylate synthase